MCMSLRLADVSDSPMCLFLDRWVTGECLGPHITQQPQAGFITTCHLLYTLSLIQPPSDPATCIWGFPPQKRKLFKPHLKQRARMGGGNNSGFVWFFRGILWYSLFSGLQFWWMSSRRRRRASPSCRRPCSWWWAGGRWSEGVPSSPSKPSGSAAGSSCSLGHCCTLRDQKEQRRSGDKGAAPKNRETIHPVQKPWERGAQLDHLWLCLVWAE